MSRIRGKNTGPEREVFRMLRREGVYFARHGQGLPGSPDIVFRRCRLAIFIDGDFWHGRHFSKWSSGLDEFWREKIAGNIVRDRRATRRLRAGGWRVMRIWTKDLHRDPARALAEILKARTKQMRTKRQAISKTPK
jgi:DNA mismatch endonuclease (patch repair protein)